MTLAELLHPISSDDIRATYNFTVQAQNNPIVTKLGLQSTIKQIGEREGPPPYVEYKYEIILSDNETILDYTALRQLVPEDELYKRADDGRKQYGKVAHNYMLFIKLAYQRMGIATLIYLLEEKLYRKWGAVEIHLTATNRGRIVWRKKGFVVPQNELLGVEAQYEAWCKELKKEYIEVNDIMRYPEEFLLSDSVKQISMYKDLANG